MFGNETQPKPPTVSVIIPCRNERDHIENCLRSILAQDPPEGGFEVIVADGMSDDGTRDILQQMITENPQIRVIDNPGGFVSSGLNVGIRTALGKIIVRMDVHTEYAPDYIHKCVNALSRTGADNAGGPARTKADGFLQAAICAAYHSPFAVGGARFHNVNYEGYVDTVTYGCWPREVFDRVGLFDEELVRNQDDEFNLRLILNGGKIWQSPNIKSWYKPRASLRALFQQYLQYGYWKVRVIQKHRRPASVRHLVPAGFLVVMAVLPFGSVMSSLAWQSWLGLLGLYALSNLTASIHAGVRDGLRLVPVLPLVFACYHFGYAIGFLRGIGDFMIFRCGPSRRYTELTRTSA